MNVYAVHIGLVGGAIVGLVVGAAQWLVLRRVVSAWWIASTAAAVALGLAVTAGLGLVSTERGDLLAIGAITGLLVGVAQALLMPAPLRVSRSRAGVRPWNTGSPGAAELEPPTVVTSPAATKVVAARKSRVFFRIIWWRLMR